MKRLLLMLHALFGAVSLPVRALSRDENASKAAFKKGVTAMEAKDFDGAVIAFKSSLAVREHPAARCNLALAFETRAQTQASATRQLSDLEAARESYLICASTDTSGRYAEHAKTRAARLAEEIARISNEQASEPEPEEAAGDVEEYEEPHSILTTHDRGDPEPPTGPWLALSLVSYGAAAATFGVGLGFALDANSKQDALDREFGGAPIPATVDGMRNPALDEVDAYEQSRDLATAFYVASGALAAVATVFLVIELATPSEERSIASVSIGPTSAALHVRF